MYINIDFLFFNDLCVEGRLVIIESVLFWLYLVKGIYGKQYFFFELLILYIVDENNVMEDVVIDILGSFV